MSGHHSKKHQGVLQAYVEGFLQDLDNRGYKKKSQKNYKVDIRRFITYARCNGIYTAKRFVSHSHELVAGFPGSQCARLGIQASLNRFIEYLVRNGIAQPVSNKPKDRYAQLAHEFTQFQFEHRGICPTYAKATRRFSGIFFDYLQRRGICRLTSLTAGIVLDFITEHSQGYARKTISCRCTILRALLTYLYRKNLIRADLSSVVIGPRIYQDEACPRFISKPQIQAILSQIDRTTVAGMRDYAMIILLATYGLRGIEVIRLCLDDIDWRKNLICIKGRKARNNTIYPLTPTVIQSLIQYLKEARPPSSARQVFITVKAPYNPLADPAPLSIKVRKYMQKADVKVDHSGTHTFRYSCAQMLLKNGTALKVISDYLGHIKPETTKQYIKIAIDDLREVACGDGEEVVL